MTMIEKPEAFARVVDAGINQGMSLRDWFAGKALTRADVKSVQEAWSWADSMIEVRKNK